jgi:hypothetical protein
MVSVDQMGVELGKVLAKNILSQLNHPSDVTGHDSSVRFFFTILSFLAEAKATCRLLVLFTTTKSTERNELWSQGCNFARRLEIVPS